MIPRYTNPEMGKIWNEQSNFDYWLRVEKTVSKAQAELGIMPKKASQDMKLLAQFDIKKIDEIEEKAHHDVIAFLTNVSSYIGENSKYLHYGFTSSDVIDTVLSLQMLDAVAIIVRKVKNLALLQCRIKEIQYSVKGSAAWAAFNRVAYLVMTADLNKKGLVYDKGKCICDIKKRNS